MVCCAVTVTVTCDGQLAEAPEAPSGEAGLFLLEVEPEPEPVPAPVPEPESGEDGVDAEAEADCRATYCVRVEVDWMVVVGLPPPTASAGADDELLVA